MIYSGNQLNDFTKSTVINKSVQTLVYTYDPTSGNGNNYTNTNQQITIAFNTPLNTDIVPDASQFIVKDSDGSTINLISPIQNGQQPIYVNKNSVVLSLAQTIPQGENYTVQYTPIQGGSNNLESAGNKDIASFTISNASSSTTAGNVNNTFISAENININQVLSKIDNDFTQDSSPALALTSEGDILLSWSSDAPNLLPISALAQGSNIYLTFGENLANNQGNYLNPEADQFVVTIDGATQSLNQKEPPNVEGNTLVLTLAQPIAGNATTVSVSYNLVVSDGSDSSNLAYIDLTGTTFWLEKFADLSVNLINDASAPTVLDLDVNGDTYNGYGFNQSIVIPFDQELSFTSENDQLPSNDFSVLINGKGVGVLQAIINETSVVLTLDNSIQIGQGNIVSVTYKSDPDNPLKGTNNQIVASFSTSNILTTPTNSGTVIKTAFSPFGDSGISEITTIPGTNGLNFDVASTLYTYTDPSTKQTNQINVLAWVQVDNDDLIIQQIPGQNYSSEQAQKINAAVSQSDIYYSVLGPDNQWSLAQPIAAVQTGQDQKVTLGAGPNGELLAAWLNTQQQSNGNTSTTIYWSSFNGTTWTTPQTLLSEISPDAFTELNISTISGQPAIFWTESQPASYSNLVVEQDPVVYLRLGELSGTTAINEGQSGPSFNGNYSGNFTLNQIGALEDTTTNTGDPNPAVLFNGGGVTLDAAIPVSIQGFSVEFWFKLPSINAIPNLVSMADVFLFTVNDTQLKFSLDNTGNSTIATTQPLDTDAWYYVVGTYDGSQDILSLYLDGELVGSLDNVSFSNFPTSQSGTLAVVGQGGSVYVDEVAFYNSVLSYVPSSAGLTASNITEFTGNQFLDGALGTNEIGNRFNAQYVDPVPAGPEGYYSVWNPTTNSWQLSGQIEPIPTITPTTLSDANFPIWDIVAATGSPAGTEIFPNGKADSIFQINLSDQQGREITGIDLTVPGTGLRWGVGQNGDGKAIGGFQVGVILGETVPNNGQLTFADGTTLLNSLNPALSGLNHRVMGETETLSLFIDETGNTFSATPTVTVYFKDGSSVTPQVSSIRNQGGTVPAKGTNDLGTEVLGIATITEANDASLANIDSGFVINTNNSAIATELASGFKSDGSLAYVAVGNRGYTDSAGNLVSGGTIQILFAGGSVLSGTESNPLTTTDLSGNPGGVLITGIADGSVLNGGVSMALATGDIDGDGIDDLVIGDANANGGDGVIYVIKGSYLTSNPGATIDVTKLTSAMGYAINPDIASAQAGFSVVVGNFDGDGKYTRNDIAFGAPGVGDGGAVYIAYNGSTSFTKVYQGISLNQVGERAGFALGVSHYSPENPTTFTGSKSSDDLLIGAPAYQVEVNNQWKGKGGLPSGSQSLYKDSASIAVGAVHVFSSSSKGLAPWGTYTGPNIPAANGVATNYFAGAAIASKDLDGDGRQDLAIAATGVNASAGAVYVISGSKATPTTSLQTLNEVSNLIVNGSISNGQAGTIIASPGDLNGDGYEDFLITAPQAGNGTGQSYLLFGPLNLDAVGTLFDLGVTSQDKTFLLNGSLPYQLAGAAATGLGNITGKTGSNGKIDSLLLTAPNAQQAYAVYGQSYLEDDGSIKLANIASDNGFVIDGNSFSTFNVVNPAIPDQSTDLMPSLVSYQGTLYMAVKGSGNDPNIYITTSTDGGKTWSDAIVAIAGATNFSPSLAVYNDVLYLAYTGLDPQLNILYSTDGGQSWSPQYAIGQASNNAPTLVVYQDKLFTFFTADNQTDSILYIYSDNPQASNSWSSDFPVTFSGGNQISPNAVSATVFDGALYLAYQTGTQSSPGNTLDITSTDGTDLSNLSWALSSIPNIVSNQSPGLTTDGKTLYLTHTTGYTLALTGSGSLVLLSPTGEQVWAATDSNNQVVTGAKQAILQGDGNFVLYSELNEDPANALWTTRTNVGSVNYLQLGSDGGLYIIDANSNNVLVTLYDNNGTTNPANSSNNKLEEGSYLLLGQEFQSGNGFLSVYEGVGTGEPLWTTTEISSNSNYAPSPTIVNNQLYLVNSTANAGYQVLETSLPPLGSIANNGSIVRMLGDINGDGFADVFSGGSNAGVIIFGDSTKDLLTEASGSDDLIITVQGADIKDVISIGDYNGDGLQDFGVLASNGNFSVVFGNISLGGLKALTITPSSSPVVINQVGGVSKAMAIGDYNGDGYDDVLLAESKGNQVVWGNAAGTLNSFTDVNYPTTQTSATGVDLNGDGIPEIAIGSDTREIAGQVSTAGSFSLLPSPTNSSVFDTLAGANQLVNIRDFNGDGIADLAVLASNYYAATLGSPLNLNQAGNQGGVFIYYGTTNGLANSSQPDVILAAPFTTVSNQQSPFFLSEIAQAGDMNGDGFDDLLINSPFTVTANDDQGSVFVVFGGNTWSNQPFDLGQLSANQSEGSSAYGFLVNGLPDAQAGFAISGGSDVNGDGFDDVAIGAPGNYESQLSQNTVIGDDKGRIWYNGQQINPGNNDPAVISMVVQDNASGLPQIVAGLVNGEVWWYNGSSWSELGNSPLTDGPWAVNQLAVQWNGDNSPQVVICGDYGCYYYNAGNWSTLVGNIQFNSPLITQLAVRWNADPSVNPDVVVGQGDTGEGYSEYQVQYYNGATGSLTSLLYSDSDPPITQMAVNWRDNGDPQIVIGLGNNGGVEYYDGSGWNILENLNPAWSSPVTQMSVQWNTQDQPQIVVGLADGAILYYNGTEGFGLIPSTNNSDPVTQMSVQWNANGDPKIVAALGNKGGVEYYNGSQWITVADANPGWSSPVTQLSVQWDRDGNPDIVVGLKNGVAIALPYNGSGWAQNGIANVGTAINQLTSLWSESIVNSGSSKDLSYVLFGSDFNQTVNQTGTIGNDVMLGTPTGESFVAGQGDDQIYTNGGLDVVYAGPGDDFVSVTDTYFRRLDGGTGLDVLALQGYNGQDWDLTTLSPGLRLRNFEVISMLDYGANTLTLNALTVTNLSSNNTVVVLMDSVDSLVLSSDFKAAGTTYQYGDRYYQYTSDLSAATVLVNQAKVPTYTAPSTNSPAPIFPTAAEINTNSFDDLSFDAVSQNLNSDPNASTRLFVHSSRVSEAIGEASFVIERTGDLDKYVLVSYLTQDGDGKAGNRYLPVAGQLIFSPGETSKTVTVQIPNDGIYTGDRQFGLLVSLLAEGLESGNWGQEFALAADGNGSQIRRWNYLAGELENSSMGGVVNFSTTTNGGQTQADINVGGIGEFNDFFSYNPLTGSYESLMFDNVTGAKFSYLDGENNPHGVKFQLVDGDRGDVDGVSNGLVETKGYLGLTIPGLISNDNRVFWAPTNADGQLQLRLINSSDQNYEMGWIAVDGPDGSINGLQPGAPGYEAAALARKQMIFNNENSASAQALTRDLAQQSFTDIDKLTGTESQFFGNFSNSNLEANRYYMLYSQQGGKTTFSIDTPPIVETDSRGYHQLNFDGITAEISSKTLVVPGILNQTVTVEASISRAGAYDNAIALYQVDSLTGGLDVNGDRQIDLKPGDMGYLQAALSRVQNPLTGVSLTAPDTFFGTTKQTINLLGNNMYGMVIIPNATIAEVLNQNPGNDPNLGPVALFSFNEANPGGISQMSRLGSNLFGFEDIVGGGDQDYNDVILQFSVPTSNAVN
uniref:Calx-beta domain-containing protein n=1 Tax=Synechocystis salina TaxID=945780 RepID=UPI002AD22658|nr:Calx-beta domain-containing protein [Synechocystis salina]